MDRWCDFLSRSSNVVAAGVFLGLVQFHTLRFWYLLKLVSRRKGNGHERESGLDQTGWRGPTFQAGQSMFAATKANKWISLTVTHAAFSGRILIIEWGNTVGKGSFECGTRKRWLYSIWMLVCILKYNPTVHSPLPLGPRRLFWITQTLAQLYSHCLFASLNPILFLWPHWGHPPSKNSSKRPFPCSEFP